MSGIDLLARARREGVAVLDGSGALNPPTATSRDVIVALLAVAWLQGVNYGSHETLAAAEEAFDRARAEL